MYKLCTTFPASIFLINMANGFANFKMWELITTILQITLTFKNLPNQPHKKVSDDEKKAGKPNTYYIRKSRFPVSLPSLYFSKNYRKRSYKKKHFVFKTLKLSIPQFQSWKISPLKNFFTAIFPGLSQLLMEIYWCIKSPH